MLIDPLYPSLAVLALYLCASLLVFLRTESERRRVRHAFGRYMSPALVERLANDPAQLELGGETRDMTMLFPTSATSPAIVGDDGRRDR